MIRAGVPKQIAEMNAQAFSLTAEGDAEWVTDDVPAILGRPRGMNRPATATSPSSSTTPASPREADPVRHRGRGSTRSLRLT